MKKTALFIIILTIFTKIIGFSREIVLSYYYGVSNISDAYLIALTIPQTIFAFIGVGIGTGYIPIFNEIEADKGTRAGDRFTNNLISVLLIISTLIVIVCFIFAEQLVKLFASGFNGDVLNLAINFTRISILAVYSSSLTYIFSARLQISNNFHASVLMGIPLNIIIILSIVMSYYYKTIILTYGFILASLSQTMFLYMYLKKQSFKFRPVLYLKDENLKKIIYLAIPVIIGVSVNQINVLVDRTIASRIVVGGITALNYANRLNIFVQAVFVMSIATIFYPAITRMVHENKIDKLKKLLKEAINVILLCVVPITIGTIIYSTDVVLILFGRGAFDTKAIELTSDALLFYSIGMVGFGFREILTRVFYSMQDTKTPTINAAIGMILNIILNVILSKYLGIGGLALATSIAAIFTTLILFINLRKKIGPFGMKQMGISFLKILFASLIMGVLSRISFNYFNTLLMSHKLSLLLAIVVGGVSYFLIIYFMKIEDVDMVFKVIKEKVKRKAI